MSYTAILENKINALPQQTFNEVAHYVDYIYTLYVLHRNQPKSDVGSSLQDEKLAALNAIAGKLSDEDAEEMRQHCHLKINCFI